MIAVLWAIATLAQLVVLPKLNKRFIRNYLRLVYSSAELWYLRECHSGVMNIPYMEICFMTNAITYILVFIGICKTLGTVAGIVFLAVIAFVIYYWMCKAVAVYIREDANKNAMIKI